MWKSQTKTELLVIWFPLGSIHYKFFQILVNSIPRLVKPVANCLNYMVYCLEENLSIMVCFWMKITSCGAIIKAFRSTTLPWKTRIRDTKADLLLHNTAIECMQ